MPNNVVNEIIFQDINRDIQEGILKNVLKNGFVDFNTLVPMPLNIWRGNAGEKEEKAFGQKIWYPWCKENWGTKWNAYGQNESPIIQTEDTLTIIFQTAGSPPRLWVCALFNAIQIPLEHNWLDEGRENAYTARFFFSGEGEYRSPSWTESESEEEVYRRLHIQLWGCEPESKGK
jgi:hypothetical protein